MRTQIVIESILCYDYVRDSLLILYVLNVFIIGNWEISHIFRKLELQVCPKNDTGANGVPISCYQSKQYV